MTTAKDVADYIASRHSLWGEMQLHKLVYYAQAWSLAWDGKTLFDGELEAWTQGPVARELRFYVVQPNEEALTQEQRDTVDAVLAFYGKFNGGELGQMTHDEDPWKAAWAKRPEGSSTCSEPISDQGMRLFYSAKVLLGGEVPVRKPTVASAAASDAEVLAIARDTSVRWRETLEILAQ